jgi:hypothetical protein
MAEMPVYGLPPYSKKNDFYQSKEALMKRKTTNSLVAKWKQVFSKEEKKPVTAVAPQQSEPKPKGASLALLKKVPVIFRLSRLENPTDFELMSFVIRACAKTARVAFLTVLHVEQTRTGSRLIATDGHRLHIAEISKKIKSGNYKPHVLKDVITLSDPVEGIKYPAWAKAIPETTVKRGVINLEKTGLGKDQNETEKLSIAFNAFVRQTGEAVNIRHIGDLTKCEWAVYSQNEKHKAIVLKQKNGRTGETDEKSPVAVIVPIAQAA